MMKFISLKTKIRQHLNPVQYSHIRPAAMQQDVPTGWESTGFFFFSPRTITNIWYFHSPLINTIFPVKEAVLTQNRICLDLNLRKRRKKMSSTWTHKQSDQHKWENLSILSLRNYTFVWQLTLNYPTVRYDMQLIRPASTSRCSW